MLLSVLGTRTAEFDLLVLNFIPAQTTYLATPRRPVVINNWIAGPNG